MLVVTADQVHSRSTADRVGAALLAINALPGLSLPAERTVGDELQVLTASPSTAVELILLLARSGDWSIGLGVGDADPVAGRSVRETNGNAFVFAREAVELAKKRQTRFALCTRDAVDADDAQAFIDLLLLLRARRTATAWKLHDLLRSGLSQVEAAARLGVTPQSASKTALAAGLRVDLASETALVRLMARLDATSGG